MNETYLGSESDQKYITAYLEKIRQLDPIEIATLPNPICLSDTNRLADIVDVNEFWEIVNRCLVEIERHYSIKVTPIKSDRYYTASPPEEDVVGGFHDFRSLGYQYWYHAAFVVTINKQLVRRNIRTIELVRSFLHDCLHHSTFRSFRRAIRIPAESTKVAKHRVPEVYREQYGVNFRNQDDISFSSTKLTARSPKTINLNLLMDGVIVLVVAEALKLVVRDFTEPQNDLEREVTKEIFLEPFDEATLPNGHSFYESVTKPTQNFVEYWGGKRFMTLVLQAMVSGKLTDLKHYFQEKTGIENAWDKLFRRSKFSLSNESQSAIEKTIS